MSNAFDKAELHRRRREEVVRTAAQAFSRNGFGNTSMDEVALSLGISKATLYQYFKSKQEILFQCHLLSIRHGEAGLELAQRAEGSGLDRLLVFLRRYMTGAFGELGGLSMLGDITALTPERREQVITKRAHISHMSDRLIEDGLRDGSIRRCDAKLAKLFAMGVVNWIPSWYSDQGERTADEIVDAFIDFFTHSFAAPQG
ncbi:MAG: TetR/AcrR family transcriptional regulator [Proteobacteria bacterium]|nr:TetR/AcrR family transcriptional regulator [Pseudomonadota bacterium]